MATIPYTYVDVKDWLVQRFKTLLSDAGYTNKSEIRVLKSDPHDAADIPCIGINLANADESNQVAGDLAGLVQDSTLFDGAGGIRRYYGTFIAETIEMRIWETNADQRDTLRIFIMAQLFGLRVELATLGLRNIRISGGRDEQDNATLQPQPIYFAPFNVSYLNPLETYMDDELIGDITTAQNPTS